MKKVMIALAAVAMVGAANAAASYNYAYQVYVHAYEAKDKSPSAANLGWYSFYGMTQDTAKELLDTTDTVGYSALSKWLGSNFAANSETLIYGSQSLSKNKEWSPFCSQYGVWEDGVMFSECSDYLCVVLFDNGTDQAYNVLPAVDMSEAFCSDDELKGGSGWIPVENIPEPTSGLLMLVGLAGLALKRKRA